MNIPGIFRDAKSFADFMKKQTGESLDVKELMALTHNIVENIKVQCERGEKPTGIIVDWLLMWGKTLRCTKCSGPDCGIVKLHQMPTYERLPRICYIWQLHYNRV